MKNYSLDLLHDEPILLFRGHPAYNWMTDFAPMADEVIGLLDQLNGPVFLVVDMTEMSASLSDLIFSTNYATRTGNQFLRHPNMREFLAVTGSKLIGLAAQGMSYPVFGSIPVRVFDTVDEALNYAHSNLCP